MARVMKSTLKEKDDEKEASHHQKLARSWLRKKAKVAVVDDQKKQRQIIREIIANYEKHQIPEVIGRKIQRII